MSYFPRYFHSSFFCIVLYCEEVGWKINIQHQHMKKEVLVFTVEMVALRDNLKKSFCGIGSRHCYYTEIH